MRWRKDKNKENDKKAGHRNEMIARTPKHTSMEWETIDIKSSAMVN
jgi:hypothetical protein